MADIDTDLPNAPHPAVVRMRPAWRDCRDLASGTRAIHAGGQRYLPIHPREQPEDYKRRATATEVYNGFRRAIGAMTGLVMQTDPAISDGAPAEFVEDWDNIDGRGTSGPVFSRHLFNDATITGLAGILVDFPAVATPDLLSLADETSLGIRPYWLLIRAEQLVSWRTARVGGQLILTQLVLREDVEEPNGRFGTAICTYYRVFVRQVFRSFDANGMELEVASDTVQWELWKSEVKPNGDEKPEFQKGGTLTGMDEIPFSPMVAGNDPEGFECAPPLQDMADVNLAHYRVNADRRHVMHLACVPIPVRVGFRPPVDGSGEVTVAANMMMDVPVGGDFFWRSPDGTAFEPTKDELDALERRMGQLAAAFLSPDTRQAETAKAKQIDSSAQNATLASTARSLKGCLDHAARLHLKYRKLESAEATFTVNTEYEKLVMDTTLVQALSTMEQAGQLTLDTLLTLLVRGHILPDDFDAEAEQEKVAKRAAELLAQVKSTQPGTQPPAKDGPPAPAVK
jgi:hypothetical protein